jgi:CHAT domain-containing protein/tetratricopeptide (TPR) repeat protein
MIIALILLLGRITGGASEQPAHELRQRADEIVAAFRAGDVARLMMFWSDQSATRTTDRRRIARLLEDRAGFDIAAAEATQLGDEGFLPIELREKTAGQTVLERYEVKLMRRGAEWRIDSWTSPDNGRAKQIIGAASDERPRIIATTEVTLPLAREVLHLAYDSLDRSEVDGAAAAFAAAGELAERIGHVPTRAAVERGLANIQFVRADRAGAIRHFERSIEIAKSADDPRILAQALLQFGSTIQDPAAEGGLTTALQLFRGAHDRVGEAATLVRIGNARTRSADHDAARTNILESQRIFSELNDAVGLAFTFRGLAIDAHAQGHYAEALTELRKAVESSRSVDDLDGEAIAVNNIAIVHYQQEHYMEALQAFEQALAIFERLKRPESVAKVLGKIGEMHLILGNRPLATEFLQRAFEVAEKGGNKTALASIFHNLARLAAGVGDYRKALAYWEQSLDINTQLGNRSGMAGSLVSIGMVQESLGNIDDARNSYDRAFEAAKQANNRETMIVALANRATLSMDCGDALSAIEPLERAVQLSAEFGLREREWRARTNLAEAYRSLGGVAEAQEELERAIAIVEDLRRSLPGDELAQRAFVNMVFAYNDMVNLLVRDKRPADAFQYAERSKARVLLDILRQGRADPGKVMTTVERDREHDLTAQLTRLNQDYRQKLGTAGESAAEGKLRKTQLAYEAFMAGLYAGHPQLRLERGDIAPVSVDEVGALLKQKAADAFLEFVVTDDVTFLFTITTGADGAAQVRAHSIAIAKSELQKEVMGFRDLLAARELTYGAAAQKLYDRLLRPAGAELRRARVVCIVADGPLWELPFQALKPGPMRFVIDRHAIFYAPSITVLREMMSKRRDHAGPRQLLAFGDPVIPTRVASRIRSEYRDVSLAPLPETETEVRRIAALYGAQKSRLHLRRDAREELAKAEAPGFAVLHFATHGIFDDQNALSSRLVFSPPRSSTEDGFLEAREIMQLKLHADVAVLSACETARGRIGAGEGVIGMSWALFVAGCPTTIVSQWKVSSASTTDLMIELHRALLASDRGSRSTAQALRRAALAVRAKPAYRHPFYWSPFVAVGTNR